MIKIALAGIVLGALSTLLSYGAGGALVVTLAVGTIVILIRADYSRSKLILLFSASTILSFYTWGFQMISDPFSIETLSIFATLVLVPFIAALLLDSLLYTREKRND